jgi:GNAT superfamily N-acetyltransferase
MTDTWKPIATLPDFLLFTWESQVVQYPLTGPPGIGYFKGEVEGVEDWVDCLLYRDKTGRVRGICNHYPTTNEFEDAGNVNIWVDPAWQRRGIGTQLLDEAHRRWPIDLRQQRYSFSGARFAQAYLKRSSPVMTDPGILPIDGETRREAIGRI